MAPRRSLRSHRFGSCHGLVVVGVVVQLGCGRFGYDPWQTETPIEAPGPGISRPADGGAPRPGPEPAPDPACSIGRSNCDGDVGNGCEAATASAVSTCGGCSTRCDNGHGTTRCADGLCEPTCAPGYGDCDGNSVNGCEQALDSVAHCGACNTSCSDTHALAACASARCAPTCASGHGDCDADPNNGCEADLGNDPAHCGGCGNVCSNGLICAGGSCVASACAASLADCDGDPAACETSLDSSLAHCGFCNNACTAANGTPTCTGGVCQVQGCEVGFGNCDGVASNGCESALSTTTEHCGACNQACSNAHGNTGCSGASCAPVCSSGFGDCDTSRQNGCEAPLDTIGNCGACGNVCPANGGTPVCNAGVCGTVCDVTGTFALTLSAPCSWPSSQYRQAGNGSLRYWLKAELVQTGNSVAALVTECGRTKPPLINTAGETVQQGFPNQLYDNDYLSPSSAAVALGTTSPGGSLAWPLTANLMGISLTNPTTDSWPSSASQVSTARRIDMDRDGKVAMTGSYDGGDYPRTSTSAFFNRADRFYFASRLSFSLSGSLSSCTVSSGTATIRSADMRILGCRRSGGTQDCSTSESDLLDTTMAPLTIGAGTYTLARVTNGAGCPAVRAALP